MKIRSAKAEACFENLGAQITSFKKNSCDIEYMWQGDEAYWKGKNPVLFPIVGNTYSKDYQIDGKTYAMGNHGLVRNYLFEVKSQNEDTLVFLAKSNIETLQQYPFDWELEVTYHLVDTRLQINYVITNNSKVAMPFTFGLHPAFNCPFKDGKFSDYCLEFEREEKPQRISLTGDYKSVDTFKKIELSYDLFSQENTMIFTELKSDYVDLTNGKDALRVGIKDYPYLAFWCGQKAPFLCIEPWYGLSDFKPNNTPFAKRQGMMELAVGDKFTASYYIELL